MSIPIDPHRANLWFIASSCSATGDRLKQRSRTWRANVTSLACVVCVFGLNVGAGKWCQCTAWSALCQLRSQMSNLWVRTALVVFWRAHMFDWGSAEPIGCWARKIIDLSMQDALTLQPTHSCAYLLSDRDRTFRPHPQKSIASGLADLIENCVYEDKLEGNANKVMCDDLWWKCKLKWYEAPFRVRCVGNNFSFPKPMSCICTMKP